MVLDREVEWQLVLNSRGPTPKPVDPLVPGDDREPWLEGAIRIIGMPLAMDREKRFLDEIVDQPGRRATVEVALEPALDLAQQPAIGAAVAHLRGGHQLTPILAVSVDHTLRRRRPRPREGTGGQERRGRHHSCQFGPKLVSV